MLNILLVILSMVGLLLGPFLVKITPEKSSARLVLDVFTSITVCGIVVFHVIPEAYHHGGSVTLLFGLAGLAFPVIIEKLLQRSGQKASVLLLFGLFPHILVESAVFGAADPEHAIALGIVIAAHRLPVGLLSFIAIQKHHGDRIGWYAIFALTAVTLLGFLGGEVIEGAFDENVFSWLQALVGGALLHIVFSNQISLNQRPKGLLSMGMGLVVGMCFVGIVLSTMDIHH